MTTSKNSLALAAGLILFFGLIASAILLESAYLLYAATAIPILLVPFIPDLKTSQTVKAGPSASRLRAYRTENETGEGFIILESLHGGIPWNKKRIYFPVDGLPAAAPSAYPAGTAGIPVLQYDLVPHRRRKDLYGIELANVAARFRTLSFTTDEVTRLVIRLEDLRPADPAMTEHRTASVRKSFPA
ncbi:MAG: hypothetical protein K0Q90_615 [Paenibacillaceae bacterium]|jgi:hypothetical protein|nr:hypothetical protein [Paenibacillaceae bacterium]